MTRVLRLLTSKLRRPVPRKRQFAGSLKGVEPGSAGADGAGMGGFRETAGGHDRFCSSGEGTGKRRMLAASGLPGAAG